MPVPQLEQGKVCDWIEEPLKEVDLASRKYILAVATVRATDDSAKHITTAVHPMSHFRFLWPRYGASREQGIWNLAHTVRMKVAREDIERYETERLIEEINEAYDEEMEREDKEFAKRTKGYYRRLLSAED